MFELSRSIRDRSTSDFAAVENPFLFALDHKSDSVQDREHVLFGWIAANLILPHLIEEECDVWPFLTAEQWKRAVPSFASVYALAEYYLEFAAVASDYLWSDRPALPE